MRSKLLVLLGILMILAPLAGATPLRVLPSNGDEGPTLAPSGIVTPPSGQRTDVIRRVSDSAPFSTIQAAIDDAGTFGGDVLQFIVATHSEGATPQIVVDKAVTIQGMLGGTTLTPLNNGGTSGDARAWFLITADGATLKDLILDGDNPGPGYYDIMIAVMITGVGADNTTIEDCTIKNIGLWSTPAAYYGRGICVYDGSAQVTDCIMSNIYRIGVFSFYAGVNTTITGLDYTGKGDGDWLDYGIEAGGGAHVSVADSRVDDCTGVALVDGSGSAGVLATTYWDPGTAITLTGSTITGNSVGVYIGYDDSDLTTGTVNGNDLSGNDDYGLVNTSGTVTVDATENWWGDTSPNNDCDGLVDYSPYWGANYVGNPHTSAWTWYTNDSIQAAIDAASDNDVIRVAAGIYPERISTTKPLQILGAGAATTTIDGTSYSGPGGAVVALNPASGNVLFDGFTVKAGAQLFTLSYHADDSGSIITISHNHFIGHNLATDDHYDFGVIGGYGSVGKVIVSLNTFDSYYNNPILLEKHLGASEIVGNTIAIPDGADGIFYMTYDNQDVTPLQSIRENVLTHTGFTSTCGGIYVNASARFATDRRGRYENVEILDNIVYGVGANKRGLGLGNDCATGAEGEIVAPRIRGNAIYGTGSPTNNRGLQLIGYITNADVQYNVFNNLLEGIRLWNYLTNYYPVNTTIKYNSLAGCSLYGVNWQGPGQLVAEYNWWGSIGGPGVGGGSPVYGNVDYDPWIGKIGGENIICLPDPLVLTSTTPDGNVVVRYLGGGGGMLYGYSMQFSWDASKVTMASVTQGTLLSSAGLTQFHVSGTGATRVVDCVLLGAQDGVPGPGDMFTIHFDSVSDAHGESPVDLTVLAARDKDNNPLGGFYPDDGVIRVDTGNPVVTNVFIDNLTLTNDSFVKNGDQLKLTATVTDNHAWPTILADLTALGRGTGPIPPDTYDGTLATWNAWAANCTPTDGLITITVNATDWLGNSGSGADNITADNTKPTALAGLAAAPGHMKVHLSWSNATGNDANYAGVLIRYERWNDYPLYDADEPEYPNVPGAGIGTAFDGTGAAATHSFGTPNRDIYYYGGFVYDLAGNYSLAATSGQARATNYWLGDVVPDAAWDGRVITADISTLADTYYESPPTNTQCDVGPTDNHGRLGIPTPDNATNFEDLMIFAMNYEVVGPLGAPIFGPPVTGATGAVTLALSLPQTPQMGSEFTVVVKLQDAIGVAQATHFQVAYDPAVLTYVGAEAGALLAQHDAVFFMPMIVDGTPDLSIAVLGNGSTFGRSGEIARLRFRQTGAGDVSLRLQDVSVRNPGNVELLAQASDIVVGGDTKPLPTEVFVRANTPNPFSHGTSIAYGLPRAQSMRLAVYDVSGRLVRVLVDGVAPAGEQTIQWDRRDSGGRVMPGGVYLYRLETRERTLTHKMIVMD